MVAPKQAQGVMNWIQRHMKMDTTMGITTGITKGITKGGKKDRKPWRCGNVNESDLISRQAAIEAMADDIRFSALMDNVEASEDIEDYKPIAEHALRNVPTIQQKKGKWEERTVENVKVAGVEEVQSAKCSACGLYHTTPYMYYFSEYKYCPNCGARMVNENE